MGKVFTHVFFRRILPTNYQSRLWCEVDKGLVSLTPLYISPHQRSEIARKVTINRLILELQFYLPPKSTLLEVRDPSLHRSPKAALDTVTILF